MRKRMPGAVVAVAAAAVTGLTSGGVAVAATGDWDWEKPDRPITGSALEQASAAALRHTGGGRVTETEVGDEESYYEVEVALDDGSEVEVQLDRGFAVVGDETEDADFD